MPASHSLLHLSSTFPLSTYYVPGTVLGAEDSAENETAPVSALLGQDGYQANHYTAM